MAIGITMIAARGECDAAPTGAAMAASSCSTPKAPPGNPYDGHTLRSVIDETQALTGREIGRVYVHKGYRGHGAPKPLPVFISGQKRGVFGVIRKELRRRSAIEAVIGHMKTDGHLGRNCLKGRHGDHANTVLTPAGYNFRLMLNRRRLQLRSRPQIRSAQTSPVPHIQAPFHSDGHVL